MNLIKTLVVDDEPLARARLTRLLEDQADIELVGEARNGREGHSMLSQFLPDLLFLDIQMPDFNGFQLLERAEREGMPAPYIIFVTAYDHYAIQAFDVKAVDYLLKPYDDGRFEKALDHARQMIELRQKASFHQKMVRLIRQHETPEARLQGLEVEDKGTHRYLSPDEIFYIQAQGNYVMVHLKNKKFLHRHPLQQLEERWGEKYLRIHRSFLLNKRFISRVHYKGNNQYRVDLYNGQSLLSGRAYKGQIQEWLAEQPDDSASSP
jgi:two-component system LytT family response regulator